MPRQSQDSWENWIDLFIDDPANENNRAKLKKWWELKIIKCINTKKSSNHSSQRSLSKQSNDLKVDFEFLATTICLRKVPVLLKILFQDSSIKKQDPSLLFLNYIRDNDKNRQKNNNRSLWHYVAFAGHKGALLSAIDKNYFEQDKLRDLHGKTIWHYMVQNTIDLYGRIEFILNQAKRCGFDLNRLTDNDGNTVWHCLALCGQEEALMQAIKQHSLNLTPFQNIHGETVFHCMVEHGKDINLNKIIKFILDEEKHFEFDLNRLTDNDGNTVWHYLALRGRVEAFRIAAHKGLFDPFKLHSAGVKVITIWGSDVDKESHEQFTLFLLEAIARGDWNFPTRSTNNHDVIFLKKSILEPILGQSGADLWGRLLAANPSELDTLLEKNIIYKPFILYSFFANELNNPSSGEVDRAVYFSAMSKLLEKILTNKIYFKKLIPFFLNASDQARNPVFTLGKKPLAILIDLLCKHQETRKNGGNDDSSRDLKLINLVARLTIQLQSQQTLNKEPTLYKKPICWLLEHARKHGNNLLPDNFVRFVPNQIRSQYNIPNRTNEQTEKNLESNLPILTGHIKTASKHRDTNNQRRIQTQNTPKQNKKRTFQTAFEIKNHNLPPEPKARKTISGKTSRYTRRHGSDDDRRSESTQPEIERERTPAKKHGATTIRVVAES